MPAAIDLPLQQLIALWIKGDSASLQGIPSLCDEIVELAALSGFTSGDRMLLHRLERLAAKADCRLSTCLEILSRTGAYSTRGAMELSRRVVTTGWEG